MGLSKGWQDYRKTELKSCARPRVQSTRKLAVFVDLKNKLLTMLAQALEEQRESEGKEALYTTAEIFE